MLGSLSSGRISDRLRARAKARHPSGKVIPEQRLPLQIFGVILSMAGILGYGWMIHFHLHVAAVLVFSFMAGFGMTWVFVTNTTYLTECSPGLPASLVAIASFFRNMGAAISSVIIDPLISKMTFGWCFTGLALIDLFSVFLVIALMVKGPVWRERLEAQKKEQMAKAKPPAPEPVAAPTSVSAESSEKSLSPPATIGHLDNNSPDTNFSYESSVDRMRVTV